MKQLSLMVVLSLAAATAFAFPFGKGETGYVAAETKVIATELGDRNLGDLKISELIPVADRLDVARQKDGFVLLSSGLSMFWPGAGQYLAGDWWNGTLHTAVHVGLTAGTLVWAEALLPSDLQWSNLNYIDTSHDVLRARWSSHSLRDYLPAMGAVAAGTAVDLLLRFWSARGAHDAAKAAIDDGKVTFEPRCEGGMGRGMLGVGMGMRF